MQPINTKEDHKIDLRLILISGILEACERKEAATLRANVLNNCFPEWQNKKIVCCFNCEEINVKDKKTSKQKVKELKEKVGTTPKRAALVEIRGEVSSEK